MAHLGSHDSLPSSKASLKAWWKQFTANPRNRKTDDEEQSGKLPFYFIIISSNPPNARVAPKESFWSSFATMSSICQRADFNCERKGGSLCVGIYSSCRSQMVCIFKTVSYLYKMSSFFLYSGLYLKENG